MKRVLVVSGLLLSTLGCDQVTKAFAREVLAKRPTQEYLGGTLRIEFAQNRGAFLSLGSGLSEHARFVVFTVAVGLFLVGATWYLLRTKGLDRFMTIGLTFLIAGGIGNLIDRVVYGHVTDFLNLGWGSLRTGIFNVADMAVVLGVALLFFAKSELKAARPPKP